MLRRDLLRAWMATPLARWLAPWVSRAHGGTAAEVPNAADVYRKAFGWTKGLTPEQSERLRQAGTIALDDPQVGPLIEQARPVLQAIREAATIDRCDWGVEIVTTDDLGKGHLDVTRLNDIRHVACLSARWHARSGQGREALDDVFAGLTLAHRVGTGGVLIARLLECGSEILAFQTLGRILPELDRSALDDLTHRLANLPPPEPPSAAIGPESRFILGTIRTRLMTVGPVVKDTECTDLGFDAEEAAALKQLTGGDRAKLLAHLEETVPAFAELARRLDLPRPGCRLSLDEFARAERTIHPIAAGLVESAWGIRHVVDRMHALRAMLGAGIALVRAGEPAFRAVPDPFGTGPFGLERRGTCHVIRSALNDRDKPEVILGIGETG